MTVVTGYALVTGWYNDSPAIVDKL